MESVYRKCYGYADKIGASHQGPENQFPVLESFFSLNPQEPDGFQKGAEIAKFEIGFFVEFFWLVLSQKCSYPFVVMLGGVDCVENFFVTIDQGFMIHLGNEVEGKIRVVA